jgi:hypothetical protein
VGTLGRLARFVGDHGASVYRARRELKASLLDIAGFAVEVPVITSFVIELVAAGSFDDALSDALGNAACDGARDKRGRREEEWEETLHDPKVLFANAVKVVAGSFDDTLSDALSNATCDGAGDKRGRRRKQGKEALSDIAGMLTTLGIVVKCVVQDLRRS